MLYGINLIMLAHCHNAHLPLKFLLSNDEIIDKQHWSFIRKDKHFLPSAPCLTSVFCSLL